MRCAGESVDAAGTPVMNLGRLGLQSIVLVLVLAHLTQGLDTAAGRRRGEARQLDITLSLGTSGRGRWHSRRPQSRKRRAWRPKVKRGRLSRSQEYSKSPVMVDFDPKFKLPSTKCGCAKVDEDDTTQWERQGGC